MSHITILNIKCLFQFSNFTSQYLGMTRNQELECMIMNLEDTKKTLESKLDDAIRALEERDRQNQCLDTR